MRRQSLMIQVRERAVTAADRGRYAVSARFFFLYLLLAWQRCSGGGEEYVRCDVIRRLPHWERNTLDSVGKQIRRHVVAMQRQGRNIIQYVKAVSGPFRLAVPGGSSVSTCRPRKRGNCWISRWHKARDVARTPTLSTSTSRR